MSLDLTDPIFHDEAKAREWLEKARWPNGVNCPHCGSFGVLLMGGKAHRPGLYHCRDCRGQFTVQTGSVMESSKIKLHKWALALQLLTSSKKGMSAHQLHRMIKVTYKTAWFMFHRIREGMADPKAPPIGGEGKIIEADEAYHGRRKAPVEWRAGISHGSVKGELASVLTDHGEREIIIVPAVGPERIRCVFDDGMRDKIHNNLWHFVRVSGLLHYSATSPHPVLVTLEEIEPLDLEEPEAHFMDARGLFTESSYPPRPADHL